jgi:hypothetical protein
MTRRIRQLATVAMLGAMFAILYSTPASASETVGACVFEV